MAYRQALFGGWLLAGAAFGLLVAGCEGCRRKSPERRTSQVRTLRTACESDADCADDNPCNTEHCVSGECVFEPVLEGTSCDDGNVCNGVARCDGAGRCAAGRPPELDDRNACTTDSCDPVQGVRHDPVHIDDADACTVDACDPRTGRITHVSVEIDDGNDCTLDTCDPSTGPQHQQPSSFSTCNPSCGEGFHAASRTPSAACGSREALRTFCAPNCGDSFHSCDPDCPAGYHVGSRRINPQCSAGGETRPFCTKISGDSFHTCAPGCPPGYQKRGETRGGQCGPDSPTMSFCVKT